MIFYISIKAPIISEKNYHRSIGISMIISITQMDHSHIVYPSHHRSYAMTSEDA